MRTSPSKYLTDFDSGKQLFYAVKLVSDSTTYYWVTSKASFTLWDTTSTDPGRASLTKDSAQISHKIDDETVYGIGPLEWNLPIQFGGGVGSVGGFTLTLLNQDELSETLDTKQFINREISLYMGFVDTSSGTGLGDMLQLGKFRVDNIEHFNWAEMVIQAVDLSLELSEKILPEQVVKLTSHPRAPEESLGKPIPLLYGDFQTVNDDADNRLIENYDLAPTVCIHYGSNEFMTHQAASQQTQGVTEVFYSNGRLVGVLEDTGDYIADLLGRGVTVLKEFVVTWYIIPDSVAQLSGLSETPGVNEFDWAKDKDLTTAYDVDSTTGDSIYFGLSRQGDGVLRGISAETDRTVQMMVVFGDVIGGGGTFCRMIGKLRTGATFTNSDDIVAADSDTTQTLTATIPAGDDFDWRLVVDDWHYGFITGGASAEVFHVVIVLKSIITLRFEQPEPWIRQYVRPKGARGF